MERVQCDLLVVGSGAPGLTAAVIAAHHGLKVIVAEKEPVFGGTTAYSAGVIWIPCNALAVNAGIEDSAKAALRYIQEEAGQFYGLPSGAAGRGPGRAVAVA